MKFLASLRLTVVCLALGILLVFCGTWAQVNEGLWHAQERWFRSFLIWWSPQGSKLSIPIMPGGYTVGIVLLANLIAAHIQRFQFRVKKLGIHLTHLGVILLLVGQLTTDYFAKESVISFHEGETKHYSEHQRDCELAFAIDAPDAGQEKVVSIPQALLAAKGEIRHEELPFTVTVKEYGPNCQLRQRAPVMDKNPPPATQGAGPNITVIPQPEDKSMDVRNLPYAIVEIIDSGKSLGTWIFSPWLQEQTIEVAGKKWRATFRPERYYHPFSIQLLNATHEVYPGTISSGNPQGIPKNFQSRVRLENPRSGENREVDIYMNNPLRYEGLTFYQYQMGRDEAEQGRNNSTLQVVRNPGWLTPYLGCILVGIGMVYQFLLHLIGFVSKRRPAIA